MTGDTCLRFAFLLPEYIGEGTNTLYEISNSGVLGDSFSTLIISVPKEAGFGMHTVKGKLVIINEQLVSYPVVVVTVAYDHRLTDGRQGYVSFAIELAQVATVSI